MLDSLDTLIAFTLIFTVLSLLVTIVVQMITSVLNLRGQNLSWAIAEAFATIEPGLAADVKGAGKKLADHLLKDSLLSNRQIFSHVGSATVVRSEELFDVLCRIAAGRKPAPPEIQAGAVSLLTALGVRPEDLPGGGLVADSRDVVAKLRTVVEALPEGQVKSDAELALTQVSATVTAWAGSATARAAGAAAELEEELRAAYQKFEHWVETGQERAQDWFGTHAKCATLLVSIVFAIGLQVDMVEILKSISTNKAMRDKLVAQTVTVLGQQEKMLGASPAVLTRALGAWKDGLPPELKALAGVTALAAGTNETRESLRGQIERQLGPLASQDSGRAALAGFDRAVGDAAKAVLAEESANYKLAKHDLDNTGFALLPPPDGRPGWPSERLWSCALWTQHGVGMLFSTLLLSLGAPFWFNTLRSFASLRSTVAGNISEEDKAALKTAGGGVGTPPPTVLLPGA